MSDPKAVRVDVRQEFVEVAHSETVIRYRWVLEQTAPVEALAMGPRTHAERVEAFAEFERARDAIGAAARAAERDRWLPLVADLLDVARRRRDSLRPSTVHDVICRAEEALR